MLDISTEFCQLQVEVWPGGTPFDEK